MLSSSGQTARMPAFSLSFPPRQTQPLLPWALLHGRFPSATTVARCLPYHEASSKQDGVVERPPWVTPNASPTSRRLSRAAPAANQIASLSEIALGPAGSAPHS